MKLTDFGLWFTDMGRAKEWFTDIPQAERFAIYYDGNYLGYQWRCQVNDYRLIIYDDVPYSVNLNKHFHLDGGCFGRRHYTIYTIDHRLTMDDFEIVENPHYRDSL